MSEKWILAEAKGKLFGDEPEVNDLVATKRQLTFEISIAEGSDENGEGLSVILTPSELSIGEGRIDEDDVDGSWNFSFLVHFRDGVSKTDLVELIAKNLGVGADERVWEDADAT